MRLLREASPRRIAVLAFFSFLATGVISGLISGLSQGWRYGVATGLPIGLIFGLLIVIAARLARQPRSAARSALDGLDPRVRYAIRVVLGFILVAVLNYVVFRYTVPESLLVTGVITVASVAIRAFQVRTWPWRSPGDDQEKPR